ncbi:Fur family transcriptional regulator [Actinacidiphila bryophytorum]|uniref:Fur family transcriptional regulator n=1 Tax=Actinacidiphila bryophytorum TaxID=1436133 RepID=UPI002176BDA6|nr:Fur family transcriptional regulator [Actinacidiphila bryophytorum]UWE10364.1 transcriptional repressor [Actinacidiphila bryophytorum]
MEDRLHSMLTEAALLGRRTPQRATVLAALIRTADFTSAQSLHLRLVNAGERVGLSTVYRTLTALAEAGRADMVREPGGERLFRYRVSREHRHYLLCRICGLGMPVDSEAVEAWAARIAEASGYVDVQHTVELTGTCPDCARAGPQDDPA